MYYLIKYKRLRERGASGRLTGSYARLLTSHSPAKLSRMPFFFILKKKVLLIFFLIIKKKAGSASLGECERFLIYILYIYK